MSKFAVVTTSLALIGALFISTPAAVYAVANDIYVGANDDATGASSCADPDFSTDPSDESSINAALDAALGAIDNDADTVIICDGDYTYAADITLHDGAVRHDVINIEAAPGADVTLDGNSLHQLLMFDNVTSVSVTGINFLDGETADYGAAIKVYDGTLSVIDCTFTSNTAEWGGAIYSEPGHVTISGSYFTNNSASDSGGAIEVWNAVDGEGVTITDSNFTGNFEARGAAISVDGAANAAIIEVTDSEFVNNNGEYGAITIDGGTVELNNVLMDGNNNTTGEDGAAGEGGAVWAGQGLTATDSEFTNNSAAQDGGAIYVSGDLEVTRSQFSNNSSGDGSEGGAIQVQDCDTVLVSDSAFQSNFAGAKGGGAINFDSCASDADVVVSRNAFTGNSARRYGGATDQDDDNFVIHYARNTFTNNIVSDVTEGFDQGGGEGGAVWAWNATFSSNLFTRNRASAKGGAVFAWDSRVARAARRSRFSGNRARRGSDVYQSRSGQ